MLVVGLWSIVVDGCPRLLSDLAGRRLTGYIPADVFVSYWEPLVGSTLVVFCFLPSFDVLVKDFNDLKVE